MTLKVVITPLNLLISVAFHVDNKARETVAKTDNGGVGSKIRGRPVTYVLNGP